MFRYGNFSAACVVYDRDRWKRGRSTSWVPEATLTGRQRRLWRESRAPARPAAFPGLTQNVFYAKRREAAQAKGFSSETMPAKTFGPAAMMSPLFRYSDSPVNSPTMPPASVTSSEPAAMSQIFRFFSK
jgi:hypothetical protein